MTTASNETPSPHLSRTASLRIGHVHTRRPVYTDEEFDEGHGLVDQPDTTPTEYVRKRLRRCACSLACTKRVIYGFLPFLTVISQYRPRNYLAKDVIAGLTVGVMHIPQGMAYGLLAGLSPIYGLYVSFLPPLIYFIFGTSHHISMGAGAVVSLMIGTVVEKVSCTNYLPTDDNSTVSTALFDTELQCRVGIATAVTFLSAMFQLGMGLLRLGFVTVYLSEPLTRGLTTGAAVHVLNSQIASLVGIKTGHYSGPLNMIYKYISLFEKITQINWATVIVAVVVTIVLVITKEVINPRVKPKIHAPVPMELFVIIAVTIVSYLMKLEEKYSVSVVGHIPTGIPAPTIPHFRLMSDLISDAFGIAIVGFAVNVSLAKLFAKKYGYNVDSSQEFIAYGMSSFIGSFFHCFASAVSLSRSSVLVGVGGKTRMSTLVSSSMVLVVLFAIGPLFEALPKCVLAAIITVNLKGMFMQITDLKTLWYISKYDFAAWFVMFTAVLLLDLRLGLLVGFLFGVLTVVIRTQEPDTCILGRVPNTDIYKNINIYESTNEINGIKIFRFEGPLYFANADYFMERLLKKTGVSTELLKAENGANRDDSKDGKAVGQNGYDEEPKGDSTGRRGHVSHIIIDCSTMGYIDWTGMTTLREVLIDYEQAGVNVYIAGCKWKIRRMLKKANFFEKVDIECMYVTIHDAVLAAVNGDRKTSPEECRVPSQNGASVGDVIWSTGDNDHQFGNGVSNGNRHSDKQSAKLPAELDKTHDCEEPRYEI